MKKSKAYDINLPMQKLNKSKKDEYEDILQTDTSVLQDKSKVQIDDDWGDLETSKVKNSTTKPRQIEKANPYGAPLNQTDISNSNIYGAMEPINERNEYSQEMATMDQTRV